MARHKAPTQVTIAPIGERSAIAAFFERYWKGLAVACLVLASAILFRAFQTERAAATHDEGWNELRSVVQLQVNQLGVRPNFLASPADLASRASARASSDAAPWMLAMASVAHAQRREYAEAAAVAQRLQREFANHPLARWELLPLESREWAARETDDTVEPRRPVAAVLEARSASMAAFVERRPEWFSNPQLRDGSPRVRLDTSAGPIELGLYEDRAPGHVANFLRLVDEGFFEGIKFHRVVPGFMIQSGDPNTREGDTATWGQGGPGYKLDAEFSDLRHVRGALAAAKTTGDVQSSGSQFYITTGSPHHLDGQHTVFGTVLSGWPAIESIEQAPRVENTERPRDPVTIQRATRL